MSKINLGRVVGKDGKGIVKIEKTATNGLIDTYTITYTDGTTYSYTVKNGKDGAGGSSSSSTGGEGLTLEQINALHNMFKKCAYISEVDEEYTAFMTAFGITDERVPNVPATGISLVPSSLTFDSYEPQTIQAVLEPAGANSTVNWISSNETIAKVENGVVTPMKSGECFITAMANGNNATCNVSINIVNEVKRYTISRTLKNCTSSSNVTVVNENDAHTETITAEEGYSLDGAVVKVTMGGVDITSSAYSNGVLNIANVTGNVIISVTAKGQIVNLFTYENSTEGKMIDQNGKEQVSNLTNISDYIRISADTDYVIQMDTTFTYVRGSEGACFYDENKNYISRLVTNKVENGISYRIIKSPENAKYCRVNYFTTSTNVMLFEGTEPIM